MKLAQIALFLGVVHSQEIFDETEEMLKVTYPWKNVKEIMGAAFDIYKTYQEGHEANQKMWMEKAKPIADYWSVAGPKYLPDLKALGETKEVKAKQRFERNVVMRSLEMRELMEDAMDMWEIMKDADWGKKATKQGWVE